MRTKRTLENYLKNKGKGFTLIELLAVIVILAIIALVAIPIVLNMIESAKKKSAESGAYGFIDAIEYNNGFAQTEQEGYTEINGEDLDVTSPTFNNLKLKGKKPTSGEVTIVNGKVTEATLCVEGYTVTYENKEVTEVKKGCDGESSNTSSTEPGLYDANNNLIESYDNLVSKYGFNPSKSLPIDENHRRYYEWDGDWYYYDSSYNEVKMSDSELEGLPAYVLSKPEYSSGVQIILPNNITSIGSTAFYGCNLTSITFESDSQLASIGDYAFTGTNLTSITIPDSVTSIGNYAFSSIKVLNYTGTATDTNNNNWGARFRNPYIEGDFIYSDSTKTTLLAYIGNSSSVTIPNGVTSIGNGAFRDSTVTSVTIPDSVTSIGSSAFSNSSLSSITIPNSVTYIGEYAFSNTNLTSITIPNGVTSIGNSAFRDSTVTSVTIPDSVTSIGSSAFSNTNLTSITIPNGVTYIGDWAFSNSSLSSITIPNSVTSIGNYAFSNTNLTLITIPDSVTSIGNYAFDGIVVLNYTGTATDTTDIANHNWGAKLRNVYVEGDFAYSDSTKTTLLGYLGNSSSVTIPDSVTTIGDSAFSRTNLKSITIPNSVTSIGGWAFCDAKIPVLIIPNSVTSIGEAAFYGIRVINYTGSAPDTYHNNWGAMTRNQYIEGDFAYSDSTKTTITSYIGSASSVTIPSGVTSIGKKAFQITDITSITIPNSVTSIGDYAFYENNNLTSVTISNGVTSIGEYAFYESDKLTSVTIPDSVTSIGSSAFRNTNLTSITIPNGVTSIGNSAFNGIDTVYYGGSATGSPWGAGQVISN